MKTKADRLIEATANDLKRLQGLKKRVADIVDGGCSKCQSLTLAFLKRQVSEIERSISRLSPRILRISRKHAGL